MYTNKWYEILKSRAPRGKRFLTVESFVSLSCRQNFWRHLSFLQLFCEIRLVVETMLKNIRCFIAFIVILVLCSFRKQGIVWLLIVFHFSP